MRGVFDEQEQDEEPKPRDTEVTLGWGTVIIAFCGLVVLCSLAFEWGYMTGQQSGKPATAVDTATTPADQEPLQGKGAVPKPSASDQQVETPPADAAPQAPADAAPQAQADASPSVAAQEAAPAPAAPVHAVLPSAGGATEPRQDSYRESRQAAAPVRPALPSSGPFMVQIAAIANPEDANVLVNALRKRNYTVTTRREAGDNLIHVKVGPFATLGEAEQWEMKLLNDGYNAVVQP